MRLFRHPRWQHLDYRVKVATTQENKPPTQGTRQWTFTTPRWRCGLILLPSLNAGVPEPTGGQPGGLRGKNDSIKVISSFQETVAESPFSSKRQKEKFAEVNVLLSQIAANNSKRGIVTVWYHVKGNTSQFQTTLSVTNQLVMML